MIQWWRCGRCKGRGSVRFTKHAGVWEVVTKILDQHARKHEMCGGGRDTIRAISKRGVRGR